MLHQTTYDPDAQRYFDQAISNGAVAGTAVWKASVHNLVVWMKSKSLWPTPSTGFDAVYLWTVPDTVTGRVNLIAPSRFNSTISGTPTFVAYKSIKGNGVDSVIIFGPNHNNTTLRLTQDSAHISAYALSGSNGSIGLDGNTRLRLLHTTASYAVSTTSLGPDTAPAFPHMYAADRTDASTTASFINGAPASTFLIASMARQGASMVLLKTNTAFSSLEICMGAFGSKMTTQQELDWYTGLRTFLLANGVAGVT